jgi:site-specific DNA-methyltransferase (adenine-specific)
VYCSANQKAFDRAKELETHAYAFIHTNDIRARVAELFGAEMQFDVVIGNPPYQLEDGGFGTSAAPIYDRFVDQAKGLNPRYLSMVIPARWFAGGKGLDEFRSEMLSDARLRSIDDYLSASDVFPGVGLKGGVCYFLWDRDNPGPCEVRTHFKDWPVSTATRPLLEEGVDVFIRFNEGVSILQKVMAVENGGGATLELQPEKRFDHLVSSRKPFGLDTTFKGRASRKSGDVLVYQNGGTSYFARSSIKTGIELIDKWKLFAGYAAPGTGNKDSYPHRIISTPFIGEPGSISSETYLCIGPFETKGEAENALSYLSCRLTRLLVLLHKPSQHVTKKVYTFVPTQDWTRTWTDADLYKKYGLSPEEVAFVEKVVRPMSDRDE